MTTESNIWTWKTRVRKTRWLLKTSRGSGFHSWSSITPRRMKQRRYRVIILTDFPSPFLVTKKKIIGNQPELLVYDVLKETFWSSASCLLFGRKKAFANFAPPLCFFCVCRIICSGHRGYRVDIDKGGWLRRQHWRLCWGYNLIRSYHGTIAFIIF